MASSMAEYECKSIEISKNYGISDWHDDLRKVLKTAGGHCKPVTFLFTDTQIKYESFVEDINGLLNSGDVPNLMASEDKAEVIELVRPHAKAQGLRLESNAQL